MKVYLLGRDRMGWSIDRDREHTARALTAAGHRVVATPLFADVVYCVWWNVLAARRRRLLARIRPVVAVATNDFGYQEETFARVSGRVDRWAVANSGQHGFLAAHGVAEERIHHVPFYVDETLCRPPEREREELAAAAGVDPGALRNRFVVGSFQRDSLGADLRQPKWQKDPDLLAAVLEAADPERILLLLAGPRRHYLLEQCRRRGIPYLFVGQEPPPGSWDDDIHVNTLPLQRVAKLWQLLDAYLVTSRAEGGPKAILEGGLTGVPVISTPVGMALDLVPADLRFETADEGARMLRSLVDGATPAGLQELTRRVRDLNRFEEHRRRIDAVLVAARENAGR